MLGEVAVSGGLQIGDGSEDAALEPLAGEVGEEVFHGVEPGAGGRREVKDPARMTRQPSEYIGMLVGFVIAEDDVDDFTGGHMGLDGIEDADGLLMAVTLHAATDDGVLQDVQGGERGRGAVTFVVMLVWTAADGIECARLRSMMISDKRGRPWSRLSELGLDTSIAYFPTPWCKCGGGADSAHEAGAKDDGCVLRKN